jgi:hypothetical protein
VDRVFDRLFCYAQKQYRLHKMNESITPTPRTEAQEFAIYRAHGPTESSAVDSNFARTLELELAEAQDEVKRLREALNEIAEKCEHFMGCPVGPATIADIALAALKAGEEETK